MSGSHHRIRFDVAHNALHVPTLFLFKSFIFHFLLLSSYFYKIKLLILPQYTVFFHIYVHLLPPLSTCWLFQIILQDSFQALSPSGNTTRIIAYMIHFPYWMKYCFPTCPYLYRNIIIVLLSLHWPSLFNGNCIYQKPIKGRDYIWFFFYKQL